MSTLGTRCGWGESAAHVTVMIPAQLLQQPLMVWIFQAVVAQVIGKLGLQGFRLEVRHLRVPMRVPER